MTELLHPTTQTGGAPPPEASSPRRPSLSVITPAYNEADNLPPLYERLARVLDGLELEWEWIVVDDHSSDATFAVLKEIAERDPRVRGVRFARNVGSHMAVRCGLDYARGDCAAALAADLQDPPEILPNLLAEWHAGAQVVWAVRCRREGESATTLGFARLYYWLMRRVVGLKDIPPNGADVFLLDRCVIDALRQFSERNVSLLALITWMGFRQASITYDKQARLHGRSGWSLEKKLKLAIDSVTSFSYLPIRLMSYTGCAVTLAGFVYAGSVIANALYGGPPAPWAILMVMVLVLAGVQMLMLGVLGEYLWRALDEARQRPRYLVEDASSPTVPGAPSGALQSKWRHNHGG